MASATHEVFKGVNLIDHVSLEDRLRGQRYSGFGCWGIWWGTEGVGVLGSSR